MDTRERALAYILKSSWLTKLERFTSPMHNPGLSMSAIALRKLRILAEFIVISILDAPNIMRARQHNRMFPVQKRREFALVIGNGPSVENISITELKDPEIRQKIDLYAVNNFISSNLFRDGICPDFYIVSDPQDKPALDANGIWAAFAQSKDNFRIILPMEWYSIATRAYPALTHRFNFFDDRSLEGFSRNINPSRPRGYLQLTAYKALAFACFGKHKKLGIIGIDNTMYKGLKNNTDNTLYLESNHLAGTGHGKMSISFLYPDGSSGYFYFVSNSFDSLRRCFSRYPIWNLDKDSLVDVFSKVDFSIKGLMGEST